MSIEINRGEIKSQAKSILKDNLGISILILAILPILISMIGGIGETIEIITGEESNTIYTIISTILSYPVAVATAKFALNLVNREEAGFQDIVFGFKVFLKAVAIGVLTTIIIGIGTFLFIIPGIVAAYALYFSFYILAENPEKSILDCMKESMEMTKGYKMKLLMLNLSFIGWIFVVILTLGLASLWVIPYMEITDALYYNEIKNNEELPVLDY